MAAAPAPRTVGVIVVFCAMIEEVARVLRAHVAL